MCIAIDTACTASDVCCMGTCGAFGADGALICGTGMAACLEVGAPCDAGAQCGCGETCGDGKCVAPAPTADAGFVAHGCIANGEPCSGGEKCCTEGAYCGAFGGTGNSLVCGLDNTQALPTNSCGMSGGGSSLDAVWVFGALALAVGLVRRRAVARQG
jgi:hypothetical protein